MRRLLGDPQNDLALFIDGLEQIIRRDRVDLLLPGSDAALYAVSAARERLEPLVRMGLPPHEQVVRSLDKGCFVSCAGEAGLQLPETRRCENPEQALQAASDFELPVVIKPVTVVRKREGRLVRSGSRMVHDAAALRAINWPAEGLLVQRRLTGRLASLTGVADEHGLSAVMFSRYLRLWPPGGGDGTFLETAPVPAGLREAVARCLKLIGWRGLFQIELIDHEGTLYALDLNPRPYGSLGLAAPAGSPSVSIWCRQLLGETTPDPNPRGGARYRWEDGDARLALWHLRRRRWRAAAQVLRPRRNVSHAFLRSGDPGPFLLWSAGFARELAVQALRR